MSAPLPPPPPMAPPRIDPPPPPEVPHRLARRVESLGCPNCGGALGLAAGVSTVTCGFCSMTFLAPLIDGLRRVSVETRVAAEPARAAARRWLASGWTKDRRLAAEARLGEAFLCFLPFFRYQADSLGFALGSERRRKVSVSGNKRRVRTVLVDVERNVERAFDRTWPGVEVGEWGVRRVLLSGDTLVPFDRDALGRAGMVFDPTVSARAVRDEARRSVTAASDPASGLERVRFRFQEIVRERLSLVYYPLWLVRYQFRGRSYQVVVDGEDGSLAYGKAPGNDLFRAIALVASQALTLFVGTTLLRAVGGSLEGVALVGLPLVAALLWGWRRFRHGGVVEEGSGVPDDSLGETLSAAFEDRLSDGGRGWRR